MSLVPQAIDRLEQAWACRPPLGAVFADHHERAVFATIAPEGPVVVKVDTWTARHDKERAVLEAAADAGLPVPLVVLADRTEPAVLVLERLEGPSLAGAGPGAWGDAGRLLRRFHDLAPPAEVGTTTWSGRSWGDHFRWWTTELFDEGGLPVTAMVRLRGALADAFENMVEPEVRLLHGDCQTDHYLVDAAGNRVTGMLDFGDAVLGDPVWDLAVLTLAHAERIDDVLAAYQPAPVLRDRVRQLVVPYWLVRRLGSAGWMREHGYDDRPDLDAALALVDLIDR